MKHALVFLLLFIAGNLRANIDHIDITKISQNENHLWLFGIVKDNQRYYSHWTPKWNYEKSKIELDLKLQLAFKTFAALPSKNAETYLLLGDIAHYLYNLDVTNYHDSAVVNYDRAMKVSPEDFRCWWFLGFHYAQASVMQKGLDNMLTAERLLPSTPPADFWNEYAWVTAIARMPSHSLFAMDKVRELTGKAGTMEEQLGGIIHKRIVAVDRDSAYQKEKIWYVTGGEKQTFTSRPLGIKLSIDSTWQLKVFDYANRTGAFIVTPPAIKNKAGLEIHFTIALLMKVVDEKDKLDDYLQLFTSHYKGKKKIKFSDKYSQMIAYEIKDKGMYPETGGGHLYMIGIERNSPRYPGMILEDPFSFPKGKSSAVTYYTPPSSKNRFKGKIFYALMLDTCEDIHDASLAVFTELFEHHVVIE